MQIESVRRKSCIALLTICVFGAIATATAQEKRLATTEAKDHIGDQATVCGKVASALYAASSRGRPTFLNLDKPYPNPVFTALIWGGNRAKFGAPEDTYRDKTICVTGKITEYRGTPQIVIFDPSQLTSGPRDHSQSSPSSIPAGATAEFRDGTHSFSQSRSGTCSHHGGVARWLQ
jgi:hypothetical protein